MASQWDLGAWLGRHRGQRIVLTREVARRSGGRSAGSDFVAARFAFHGDRLAETGIAGDIARPNDRAPDAAASRQSKFCDVAGSVAERRPARPGGREPDDRRGRRAGGAGIEASGLAGRVRIGRGRERC
jgi:hypothetical protein